mmetsp:Transcript_87904/g.121184  ORF Transcript_87904/g.121184 Transcript_87904/m.121184 type:complete len:206 (-) Transcript_87904:48-665(-)
MARTVFASVSVVRFVGKSVALSVSVGVVLPATVATVVTTGRAVNKLLLRERNELTRLHEVGTFETTSGGESPAGTARTLILDGGDGTFVDPVNAGGEALLGHLFVNLSGHGEFDRGFVTKHSSVLSISKVRHVVVTKLPGGVGGVVCNDVGFGFHKSLHSEFEFSTGTVGFAPLLDPFHEGGLVGSNSSDKHSGESFHPKFCWFN